MQYVTNDFLENEREMERLRDRGCGAAKILPTFKLYTKAVDTLHKL